MPEQLIKLKPKVVLSKDNEDVDTVLFSLTLVIDKDNKLVVVDDSQHDWKDAVDCNTLVIKHVKIHAC